MHMVEEAYGHQNFAPITPLSPCKIAARRQTQASHSLPQACTSLFVRSVVDRATNLITMHSHDDRMIIGRDGEYDVALQNLPAWTVSILRDLHGNPA